MPLRGPSYQSVRQYKVSDGVVSSPDSLSESLAAFIEVLSLASSNHDRSRSIDSRCLQFGFPLHLSNHRLYHAKASDHAELLFLQSFRIAVGSLVFEDILKAGYAAFKVGDVFVYWASHASRFAWRASHSARFSASYHPEPLSLQRSIDEKQRAYCRLLSMPPTRFRETLSHY